MERKRGGGGGGEGEDRGKGCHVELKVDNHKTQHLSLLFSSSSSLLFRFHCLVVAATKEFVGVIIVN